MRSMRYTHYYLLKWDIDPKTEVMKTVMKCLCGQRVTLYEKLSDPIDTVNFDYCPGCGLKISKVNREVLPK